MDSEYSTKICIFCQTLSNFFAKTISENFIKFIKEYSERDGKWILCSDYCLHDKNKQNNVMSYVLFPYLVRFDDFTKILNSIQPKDLKHTKYISDEFNNFLKSGIVYNINFIVDNDCNFYRMKDRNKLMLFVDNMVEIIHIWIDDAGSNEQEKTYKEYIGKLNLLKNEMHRKNFNVRLFTDLLLDSILSSYLYCFVKKYSTNISIFSRLPDRDSMNIAHEKVQNVFDELFIAYFEQKESIFKNVKRCLFNNDFYNGVELPYDAMIRVADIVCGTLADCDLKEIGFSSKKQLNVLLDGIVNNRFVGIARIKNDSISKVAFTK